MTVVFLPRDAMHARYMLWPCVRLSVSVDRASDGCMSLILFSVYFDFCSCIISLFESRLVYSFRHETDCTKDLVFL